MSDTARPTAGHSLFARMFTDHPATVGESYFQHMRFAASFAFWLSVAACAALLHALIPALCKTTPRRILARLSARMGARH